MGLLRNRDAWREDVHLRQQRRCSQPAEQRCGRGIVRCCQKRNQLCAEQADREAGHQCHGTGALEQPRQARGRLRLVMMSVNQWREGPLHAHQHQRRYPGRPAGDAEQANVLQRGHRIEHQTVSVKARENRDSRRHQRQ